MAQPEPLPIDNKAMAKDDYPEYRVRGFPRHHSYTFGSEL